jgi:SulP family sulfate permease
MTRHRISSVLSELSGAVADLGITLPLAFVLIVFNGFPAANLFLLWGLAYVATGLYFKVPVSIQPLKAMVVIAITAGFSPDMLATTAFFYGVLLLVLTFTGLIDWLQRWFSPALVRGIQLGIGLMLARKAFQLVSEHPIFLGSATSAGGVPLLLLMGVFLLLFLGHSVFRKPIGLLVLAVGVAAGIASGLPSILAASDVGVVNPIFPDWRILPNIFVLLILPQLPLTLGNAIFAANDACQELWLERSGRVSTRSLAGSIGISNIFIGLLGGFPVCHGAGGIAAHAHMGGKTGATTIILGVLFITVALAGGLSNFLFLIPVPVLGALLMMNSWGMISLVKRLAGGREWIVALLVGGISFASHHLALALVIGLIVERLLAMKPEFTFVRTLKRRLNLDSHTSGSTYD